VKRSQQSALRARDDGLRRVRKITWRIGLLAAAAAAFVGARFAHLSPSLPHLPSGLTSGSGTGSGTSSGQSSSSSQGSSSQGSSSQSGISSSSGVSSAGSGGQVTSGGS
jgi:hypothetical protein